MQTLKPAMHQGQEVKLNGVDHKAWLQLANIAAPPVAGSTTAYFGTASNSFFQLKNTPLPGRR